MALIKFFSHGKGGGKDPVEYLTATEVLAYDSNRNLIFGADGAAETKLRDPAPAVMRGNPDQMIELIDACPHEWKYRSLVVALADDDEADDATIETLIDEFEATAFAGLDPEQYDTLWVKHMHEGNVELHCLTPRMELISGKSLNIAPPGHERIFGALQDLWNKTYGWADPYDPLNAREIQPSLESPVRAQSREQVHDWIMDQISGGLIQDRQEMISQLSEAGFNIPRAGRKYITVEDPDSGTRWRLKGEIFHETWEAKFERQARGHNERHESQATRLDAITLEDIRGRLETYVGKRAEYNRERYQQLCETHSRQLEREAALDGSPELLASMDDCGGWDDNSSLSSRDELSMDAYDEFAELGELGDLEDNDRRADDHLARRHKDHSKDLHHPGSTDHMSHSRGEEIDEGSEFFRGYARLLELGRTIDSNVRKLTENIARYGKSLEQSHSTAIRLAPRLFGAISACLGRVRTYLKGADQTRSLTLRDGNELQRGHDELGRTFDQLEGTFEELRDRAEHTHSHDISWP